MLRELCIILCLIFIVLLTSLFEESSFNGENGTSIKQNVLWSAYFDDDGKKERRVNRYFPCVYHTDRTNPLQNDALVFHGRAAHLPPKERMPNQIYFFRVSNFPYLIVPFGYINKANEFYNWTTKYHQRSNYKYYYKFVVKKLWLKDFPYRFSKLPQMMYNRKSNEAMVLWVVNNCFSEIEKDRYIESLNMSIKVDVIGKCGMFCAHGKIGGDCDNVVSHFASTGKYKFYLSFEYAAREDYITEKVFTALDAGLVPIVYDGLIGKDYTDMLPPHSFIDVRNFRSAKDLADYLMYLDENDSEYKKYFKWKNEFELLDASVMTEKLVYELCDAFHDGSMMHP